MICSALLLNSSLTFSFSLSCGSACIFDLHYYYYYFVNSLPIFNASFHYVTNFQFTAATVSLLWVLTCFRLCYFMLQFHLSLFASCVGPLLVFSVLWFFFSISILMFHMSLLDMNWLRFYRLWFIFDIVSVFVLLCVVEIQQASKTRDAASRRQR